MKRTTRWTATLGSVLVAALCGACDSATEIQTQATTTEAQEPAEQTAARLLERSDERLALVTSGNWIEAYDFMSPTIKQWMSIYQFLENKGNHQYTEPGTPEVVAIDGDVAFVQISVLWTPTHPILSEVDNVPEDYVWAERIEMIETWEWDAGDWHMRWPPERPSDFYPSHPELLRGDDDDDAGDEVAKTDGQ